MKTEIVRFKPAHPLGALLKKLSPLLLAAFAVLEVSAQPTAFTYQGLLNDGPGPANGLYDFTFALFDAATNGDELGGALTNAATTVSNGLFTVTLDFGNQFSGTNIWLQIGVVTNGGGPFSTLSPRQLLTAAPYAVRAIAAGSAGTATTATTANSVAATNISGTVPDTTLSANVALLNGNNGFTGTNALTDVDLHVRSISDPNHGLGYYGSFKPFQGVNIDGPVLYGASGGALGSMSGGQRIALQWNSGANVTIPNSLNVGSVVGSGSGLTNLNVDLVAVNSHGAINWMTNATTNYPGNFVLASTPGVGNNPQSVVAVDVNGDGKLDLVCANFFDSTLTVLTNDGTGHFVVASSPGVGRSPQSVVSADVNGDGKPDLISANYSANTLSILTNDGTGNFVVASSPGVGNGPTAVVAADVNGDGKVDLICANYNDKTLTVLTNNGSGGFAVASTPGVGTGPIALAAADVNGDGKVDLICANLNGYTLTVLTNNGSGGFVVASTLGTFFYPYSVAAADVNGDGKVDLICAEYGVNALSVLTNNGHGGFVLASTLGVGSEPIPVVAADVNGDGKVDLVCANSHDNTLSVLTNDGRGGFTLASVPSVGQSPRAISVADVNGDGRPDLITANSGDGTLSVLTNTPIFTYSAGFGGSFSGNGNGLTGLAAANLTGTVPLGQLPGAVLTNNANGANLTGSFSGGGGGLTNLNAAALTGTVADARLSANVALLNANQTFAGSNSFNGVAILTNVNNLFAGAFTGNGGGLTNLNVAALTGTVAVGQLSTNVALRTGGNTFSGSQLVSDGIITGSATLDQEQTAFDNASSSFETAYWQSFTAGLSGALTEVALIVASPVSPGSSPGTISIYAGQGTGGALLSSQSVTFADVGATFTSFSLSVPCHVQAGSQYTIGFTIPQPPQNAWVYTKSGSPYAGGRSDLSPTIDYVFKTYVAPTTNVPILMVNPPGFTANVGIGTASPQAKLHVVGGVLASGTFTGDGSGLTNLQPASVNGVFAASQIPSLDASKITTGVLADARLAADVALLGASQTFSGVNALNNAANSFSGNGAGLTSLSATNLIGTLADSLLSPNVALLNASHTFSGSNIFSGVAMLTNAHNTFVGNGAGLSSLPATNLTGSVPSASLTSVPAGNLTGSVPAGTLTSVPAGNLTGSVPSASLTSIPAGNLTGSVPPGALTSVPGGNLTGTVGDARLSTNVALLSANQTFSGTNIFSTSISIGNQGTRFSQVQDGIFVAGSSTTNSLVVTSAFPAAFATVPNVTATAMSQAGTDYPDTFCVTVRRVTTTNFVANIVRVDQNGLWGQNLRISYHAWE